MLIVISCLFECACYFFSGWKFYQGTCQCFT